MNSVFVLLLLPLLLQAPEVKPTIPDLIAKLKDQRAQMAALKSAESKTVADLKALVDEQNKLLADLGLYGPPVPPSPPKPDLLAAKLKAAYTDDLTAKRAPAGAAKQLAALYKLAIPLAASEPNGKELLRVLRESSVDVLKGFADTTLDSVRNLISDELEAIFGIDPTDTTLSDSQRKAAADLFGKIADVLGGL